MSSSLQIDPRLASTVCCCLFRGLATIAVLELGRNGTHFGNGTRSKIISLRTYHEWPVCKRAIHVCARRRRPRPGPAGAALNEERSMAGYGGVDYIDFYSQLNEEEKLVRQTAPQFVGNEIIPII